MGIGTEKSGNQTEYLLEVSTVWLPMFDIGKLAVANRNFNLHLITKLFMVIRIAMILFTTKIMKS